MDLSQQAASPLSDKYDDGQHRQTEEDIYNEASTNVDDEPNDVTMQHTLNCVYQNQREIQQPYEPLDNSTRLVRPQQPNPYQEINNDMWCKLFPVKCKPTAPVQLQPISNISHKIVTKEVHDPFT